MISFSFIMGSVGFFISPCAIEISLVSSGYVGRFGVYRSLNSLYFSLIIVSVSGSYRMLSMSSA